MNISKVFFINPMLLLIQHWLNSRRMMLLRMMMMLTGGRAGQRPNQRADKPGQR
jgi:hypothetical protein